MVRQAWTIYTASEEEINADLLRAFLAEQVTDRLFAESLTLELKRERSGHGVVNAIAAMANTAGGVVLLGVDEMNPVFDESPGVDPSDLTAVLNQCQSVLDPPVLPELIPVAIPNKDRIVLVIRVKPDPALWPVVKGGQIWVRQPGKTVTATHRQVVELLHGGESHYGGQMFSVPSMFTPGSEEFPADRDCDFLVRVAGAVYARPLVANELMLGSSERAQLEQTFVCSPLAQLAACGHRSREGEVLLISDERSSTLIRAHADFETTSARNRIRVEVRCSGPQVAFALDFRGRASSDSEGANVERHQILVALMCAVETAAESFISAIARLTSGSPARVDDLHCWMTAPHAGRLYLALNTDDVTGPRAGQVWSYGFQLPVTEGWGAIADAVRPHMTRLCIDLGIDDENVVFGDDLKRASEVRRSLYDEDSVGDQGRDHPRAGAPVGRGSDA